MDIIMTDEYEIAALKEMANSWLRNNFYLIKEVLSYPEETYKGNYTYEVLIAGERVCRYIAGLKQEVR